MNDEKIVKPACKVLRLNKINSFNAIGDPGCDGLGTSIMMDFARALTIQNADFNVILGDIVPIGLEKLYKNVSEFINLISPLPVYTICGNHDTDFYEKYFGAKNYAVCDDKLLLVFLDNSARKFDNAALDFFEEVLKSDIRDNVMLFFHIPPPNGICRNSISAEEFSKLKAVYAPYKDKVKYIVCGHVHSFFETEADGIKLLVSGGGGARIESIDSLKVDNNLAYHHILNFYYDDKNALCFKHITIDGFIYDRELSDPALKEKLRDSFFNECAAHVKYKIFAQKASEKGLPGLSSLFNAAADAEFYHAMNHYSILNTENDLAENLKKSQSGERYEVDVMYKQYLEHALDGGFGLARYSFSDAMEAEKIHARLFSEAQMAYLKGGDISVSKYYTCTSCGHTFKGENHPKNCPVCGAPGDKIKEIK
ncbi:MAG: ferritin family protein [Candidatus Wallbacteria bacterium]